MESRGERKSVRVTIYNQPYTLGVAGEPGEVEALAHAVDELMLSIAQRAGNVDSTKVAVLACLQLADQLRGREQELEQLKGLKTRVAAKSREFAALLDGALE
jgi:cell division protein ZapA